VEAASIFDWEAERGLVVGCALEGPSDSVAVPVLSSGATLEVGEQPLDPTIPKQIAANDIVIIRGKPGMDTDEGFMVSRKVSK